MKRKNGGVTAARIYKALEEDEGLKYFLGHGRGFVVNDIGFQAIRPILLSGVDQYLANADRFNYALNGNRHSQMPSYQEIFSFNAIPTVTPSGTNPTWTFGGPPINSKFRVESEDWHFTFGNSSFSSIVLDFFQLCPRRDIFVGEDAITSTMQLDDNYATIGLTNLGATFATSETENLFKFPCQVTTNGITPYDNRQLTQDYLIKGVGHKVMEPGSNFEWRFRKGRYTYETPDALNPVVAYRKGRFEALFVKVSGEPVKCTGDDSGNGGAPTGTTHQDVTTASGKLIWHYNYRMRWHMPIQELRNKVTVRQTDLGVIAGPPNTVQVTAGFPAQDNTRPSYSYTASSALQVQAVPVPSGGLTGFLPTNV